MVKAIDIHTHVFNLRYLPVAGILDGSGLVNLPTWLAKALAKLALAATPTDPLLDHESDSAALFSPKVTAEVERLKRLLGDFEANLHEVEAGIPEESWADANVQAALVRADQRFADAKARGWSPLRRLLWLAKKDFPGVGRRLDWVFTVATARERTILRLLMDTYGADVDLFVHHMMDMKNHYRAGITKYPFSPRQIDRMQSLVGMADGRLATFVAFDPFRTDSLAIVREAVERKGCIGVKVYPPSGYRPWENDGSDDARRHVPAPPPEILDRRCRELFLWCAREQVPVFTHCTPKGFEAYEEAGLNGDPVYWEALLASDRRLRTLRLCLGHAGGDAWFSEDEPSWENSFAARAYALCTDDRFPNVYCEVGILSDVSNAAARQRFAHRLARLLDEKPGFIERVLYGSDWHMLYMEAEHRRFFDDYVKFCAEAGLTAEQKAGFFRNNAVRYLGLPNAWLQNP